MVRQCPTNTSLEKDLWEGTCAFVNKNRSSLPLHGQRGGPGSLPGLQPVPMTGSTRKPAVKPRHPPCSSSSLQLRLLPVSPAAEVQAARTGSAPPVPTRSKSSVTSCSTPASPGSLPARFAECLRKRLEGEFWQATAQLLLCWHRTPLNLFLFPHSLLRWALPLLQPCDNSFWQGPHAHGKQLQLLKHRQQTRVLL